MENQCQHEYERESLADTSAGRVYSLWCRISRSFRDCGTPVGGLWGRNRRVHHVSGRIC